jgi:hypothetical protein
LLITKKSYITTFQYTIAAFSFFTLTSVSQPVGRKLTTFNGLPV